MPNMGGLELIERITHLQIPVLTVIMTGFGTVETAIEAMKQGAYDYILKPFKVEEVVHIVQRGLDWQRLQHENLRLKDALSIYRISEAIATSLSVEKVLDLVLDATLDAIDADVVSLLLEDRTGRPRRHRWTAAPAASSSRCARPACAPIRTSRRRR
jgi:DNA-binding NtrC family response regulator